MSATLKEALNSEGVDIHSSGAAGQPVLLCSSSEWRSP